MLCFNECFLFLISVFVLKIKNKRQKLKALTNMAAMVVFMLACAFCELGGRKAWYRVLKSLQSKYVRDIA